MQTYNTWWWPRTGILTAALSAVLALTLVGIALLQTVEDTAEGLLILAFVPYGLSYLLGLPSLLGEGIRTHRRSAWAALSVGCLAVVTLVLLLGVTQWNASQASALRTSPLVGGIIFFVWLGTHLLWPGVLLWAWGNGRRSPLSQAV